ncbi:MAG: hypothetical protein HPY83_06185 [Anaerolineae bacterium]|nr:hypothetical protein [Anaerolineae bacterium]
MVVFIRSVSDNWLWLALGLLLLSLWSLRQAALAHRECRFSIFGLEKEQARRRVFRSLRRSFALLLIIGGLYLANLHLVPLLPEPEDRSADAAALVVPTITSTPTSTPWVSQPAVAWPTSSAGGGGTPTPTPTRTVTPTPETTPTPTPTPAPAVPSTSGCGHPGVQITSPSPGATVSGVVTISGVANIEGFQFYKVEVGQGDNPAAWAVISDVRRQPVDGGQLESWNTAPYPAGPYWLRLVVVDQTGNYPSPCAVRVVVAK